MNAFSLTIAFVMGFTGSLHCAGMCGPIIWVMPFQMLSGFKKWMGIISYHFGRITTYALLATVLYSFRSLFHPQVQQYVSIILGGLLLVAGIISFFPNHGLRISLPWAGYVKKQLGNFIGRPGISTLLISGFLNGLLPCGLVYMALSAAITAPSAGQSIAFMYFFGLGTMPMLVALTILKSRFSFFSMTKMRKMVPAVMLVFGCLFMLRGMNLGIPYLSPKILVTQHSIQASCCHKNR